MKTKKKEIYKKLINTIKLSNKKKYDNSLTDIKRLG